MNNNFSLLQRYNKWRLKNNNFTVFSNDCWGAEVYHYYDLAYNTPFIGLYLMAPCYIKFLMDPQYYFSQKLEFSYHSKYESVENLRSKREENFPTACIQDIEIQFLHYKDEKEALEKWNRRKERINYNNLFVKFDGSKDESNDELIRIFDNLPYKNKICICNRKIENIKSLVYCHDWQKDGSLMFAQSIKYFRLTDWLNGKGLKLK
jgi:uncharacterized protein (DUF1919 family)